jgi:hypothetical protein
MYSTHLLFDKQAAAGKLRFGGKVYAELSQARFIPRGGEVGQVHLAAPQFVKPVDTGLYGGVEGGADGQGDERLLNVQAGLTALQNFLFEAGDGFYDYGG